MEQNIKELPNVEVIPFLQKNELFKAYRGSAMMLLPTRQECWGLVINEAASFGTPIVSTWGSGAAVEFLAEDYPCYLAQSDNASDLLLKVQNLMEHDSEEYSRFLLKKSLRYSIEECVLAHREALDLF